jgi:hypothetical protein
MEYLIQGFYWREREKHIVISHHIKNGKNKPGLITEYARTHFSGIIFGDFNPGGNTSGETEEKHNRRFVLEADLLGAKFTADRLTFTKKYRGRADAPIYYKLKRTGQIWEGTWSKNEDGRREKGTVKCIITAVPDDFIYAPLITKRKLK